jgi:hypothetical protein
MTTTRRSAMHSVRYQVARYSTDGSKPPSERKLTKGQVKFHQTWPGHIHIVESVEDVYKLLGVRYE